MPEGCHDFMRGLCLSYHHNNPVAVGSRRFRSLSPLLEKNNIELNLLAGKFDEVDFEPRVITAGSFSPFSSTLNLFSRLKNRLFQSRLSIVEGSEPHWDKIDYASLSEFARDKSLRSLFLSIEELPDQNAGWILPAIWKSLHLNRSYDFIVSTAPPWSSHIAATFIGRRLGLPVILDERDPWVGSPGRMTFITHPLIRRFDNYLANYCYSRATGIVCVTEAAYSFHREKQKSNSIPIGCFPNGYDPCLNQYYSPPVRTSELKITYVGSLYHGRSPMIILNAAKMLDGNIAKDFHFHFVGKIFPAEITAINNLDKKFRVTLHGLQSHKYCIQAINESDICLLMAIGQSMQIPAKLYEYIGLGRPILSISESKDATMQLLENKNWAWTAASNDKADLTRLLTDIHQRWNNNDLPQFKQGEREKYSFKQVADGYSKFIRQVVQNAKQGKG